MVCIDILPIEDDNDTGVAFSVALAQATGGRLRELACGTQERKGQG
jgi:hypothetical protein